MSGGAITVADVARVFDVPLWVIADRSHQRSRLALTASRGRLSVRRRTVAGLGDTPQRASSR